MFAYLQDLWFCCPETRRCIRQLMSPVCWTGSWTASICHCKLCYQGHDWPEQSQVLEHSFITLDCRYFAYYFVHLISSVCQPVCTAAGASCISAEVGGQCPRIDCSYSKRQCYKESSVVFISCATTLDIMSKDCDAIIYG